MEIDFDPDKDAKNIKERGLTLALGVVVLANLVGEFEDTRTNYGEQRIIAFGFIGTRLMCCVYTQRGDLVRFISLRKANKKEQARWRV
jgi:uncharacterized protein